MLQNTCFVLHVLPRQVMLLSLQTRPLTISFLYVNHVTPQTALLRNWLLTILLATLILISLRHLHVQKGNSLTLIHRSALCSSEISNKDEELDLPSLYQTHKLHKSKKEKTTQHNMCWTSLYTNNMESWLIFNGPTRVIKCFVLDN